MINGGKIVEVKAAGSATGTSVEVRQLFFNLPARRKFLRTEETESAHIQHYLTLAALAYPEVAFTFQKDGRLVWQLPAQKSGAAVSSRLDALRERLRAALGAEKLLSVNFAAAPDESVKPEETDIFETAHPEETAGDPGLSPATRHPSLKVWGFIGAPGVSRATREDQHLFVNRRPVENRGLNFALLEGYHTALMKGRYPVCCLFLEIDPAAVDVNIHPAKREVKFHREFEIRKFVAQAVQETLLAFHAGESKVAEVCGRVQSRNRRRRAEPESAPALPNFPEKLKPTPAIEPPKSPGEQPPLRMGFAPSEPVAGRTAIASHESNPGNFRNLRPNRIRNPQSAIRNRRRRCSMFRSGSSASSANFMPCWNPTADSSCWTSTPRTNGYCSSKC